MPTIYKGRPMSESTDRSPTPRSIRQKRILDVAADRPDASCNAIAAEIPSVTPAVVEEVLEEFGDPADDQLESTMEPGDSPMATDPAPPDLDDLTDKQREILRTIADHPGDTQRELAERLDVTAPTISKRVNSIPGFEWGTRQDVVAALFGSNSTSAPEETSQMASNNLDHSAAEVDLEDRVTNIENQLEILESESNSTPLLDKPELAHKVIQVCIQSEEISIEEELELLQAIFE